MNSKATFAVTMAVLVALVIGGGYAGYRIATHEPAAQAGPSEQGPTIAPAGTGNNAAPSPRSSDAAGTPAAGVTSAANSGGTPVGGTLTSTAGQANGAAGTSEAGTSVHGGSLASTSEGGQQVNANGNAPHGSNANPAAVTGTTGTSAGTPPNQPQAASPQNTNTNAAAPGAGDAAAGAAKFVSAGCVGCHGADAHGGVGPNLTTADGPKSWTLDQFTAAVREGKAPNKNLNSIMPRFSKDQLSDTDIANIQAHLKTLQ